jgi:hypothetical protein
MILLELLSIVDASEHPGHVFKSLFGSMTEDTNPYDEKELEADDFRIKVGQDGGAESA